MRGSASAPNGSLQTGSPCMHRMGRRNDAKNYRWPGVYHITINVAGRPCQPLGIIVGDLAQPDGAPDAPRVALSPVGQMVEHELLNAIPRHYPMVEIQDYVVMPDHLHAIIVVRREIFSANGRSTHLGQVIAGFKKGCNRRYWEMTGQQGKPAAASPASAAASPAPAAASPAPAAANPTPVGLHPAVSPQGYKVPSAATSGRPPLFASGYVDVMPLREGQLEQQRLYIHNNPRSRLMRSSNHALLSPRRGGISTALSPKALRNYLQHVCAPSQLSDEVWENLQSRLLIGPDGYITADTYGDRALLDRQLLPVVCHRRDRHLFPQQKNACIAAAETGIVLVSPRIAKGEQDIMDTIMAKSFPVVLILDNGMPQLYHPSERLTSLCSQGLALLVSPWRYAYRHADEAISESECKAMNCVSQALCRTKDSWWKDSH